MKIYIASSWRNEHGVQMLTELLRQDGHEVISWVENNYGENHNHVTKKLSFDEWMQTDESDQAFRFDTNGATQCDLLILFTYAGNDAHAEMGAAWACGIPIIGLRQKGADYGLMSKMVMTWCSTHYQIVDLVNKMQALREPVAIDNVL